jgi:asparagine synthetase B (glutamine-hydrolysing)
MYGICEIPGSEDKHLIEKMLSTLKHRGPGDNEYLLMKIFHRGMRY